MNICLYEVIVLSHLCTSTNTINSHTYKCIPRIIAGGAHVANTFIADLSKSHRTTTHTWTHKHHVGVLSL